MGLKMNFVVAATVAVFVAGVASTLTGNREERLRSDEPAPQRPTIVWLPRNLYWLREGISRIVLRAVMKYVGRLKVRRLVAACASGQHGTCVDDPRCDCECHAGPPTRES